MLCSMNILCVYFHEPFLTHYYQSQNLSRGRDFPFHLCVNHFQKISFYTSVFLRACREEILLKIRNGCSHFDFSLFASDGFDIWFRLWCFIFQKLRDGESDAIDNFFIHEM